MHSNIADMNCNIAEMIKPIEKLAEMNSKSLKCTQHRAT